MIKFRFQVIAFVLITLTACGAPADPGDETTGAAEDTLPTKTELPSAGAIEANLESINARDSMFSIFQTIAGVSYGDPIEKATAIYGEPDKIFEPDPEIAYHYYFDSTDLRILSFQYNPQLGNVIESVFYGPVVDVFDSVPNPGRLTDFKDYMHEKCPADGKIDFIGKPMDEIKTLYSGKGLTAGGFGSDLWSQIYESSYMDVKFIRVNAGEVCGEINVFWRYDL